MKELLVCLFRASEKAASIARACRAEEALFQLLVEEKTGEDKNAKFDQDFKTLADVLIQETVRHDVSKSFPALRDNIMGEESNKFTNKLGESLTVEVKETVEATTELLVKVLDNNEVAAKLLAKHVHAEVTVEETEISGLSGLLECDPEELAVWIDPIDATSQYIQGGEDGQEVPTQGLQVVTVLLGAFLRSSGTPVLGLVNQPFGGPGQRLHWAVAASQGGWRHSSTLAVDPVPRSPPRILVGSSESPALLEALSSQYEVVKAGGAGHKLLMVSLGLADLYINTGPSTFQWDTCAPQALLLATGGGLVDAEEGEPITYSASRADKANSRGVVAFRAGMDQEVARLLTLRGKNPV